MSEASAACRKASVRVALLLASGLAVAASAMAQEKQGLKEVLGRVQTEAETKAVDDLVGKLKGVSRKGEPGSVPAAPPPPGAAPEPKAAAPAPAAPAPPAAAPPAPPKVAAPEPKAAPPAPPKAAAPEPKAAPPPAAPAEPKVATPSSPAPPAAGPQAPVTPEEAVRRAETKQAPSVDIEVFFAYDSADISPKSVPILTTLGRALKDAQLAEDSFLVAGHTDNKGGYEYNLALSQRRAEAVRKYLIDNFGIPADKLVARGFAFKHLKTPGRPRAPENRRVQIVNMSKDLPAESRR